MSNTETDTKPPIVFETETTRLRWLLRSGTEPTLQQAFMQTSITYDGSDTIIIWRDVPKEYDCGD